MSDMIPKTPQDAIDLLNEALRLDPHVMGWLIAFRGPCNDALAEHPTIQVGQNSKDEPTVVGMLGILNGIFGKRDNGMGFIGAVYDGGKLVRFELTDDAQSNPYMGGVETYPR